MPITGDGRAKLTQLSMYPVLWGCLVGGAGNLGVGRALESLLGRAEAILEGEGSTEGHEKSLSCSGINKCKLLEKLCVQKLLYCGGGDGEPGVWGEEGVRLGIVIYPSLFQL